MSELEPPANPELTAALTRWAQKQDGESFTGVVRLVPEAKLLLAVRALPPGFQPGLQTEDLELPVLATQDREGKSVLLAFSNIDELRSRAPGATWVSLMGVQVLEMALESYDSLVLDIAGGAMPLSADFLREWLLGQD